MDDGEREFRILLLFADGRKNRDPAVFDLQDSFGQITLLVSNLQTMQPLDAHFLHLIRDRVFPVACKTIHAGSHQEMCPRRFCCTEQLVNIALTVTDMNATLRGAKTSRRLFQVL